MFDEKAADRQVAGLEKLLGEYEADLERTREMCGSFPTTACSSLHHAGKAQGGEGRRLDALGMHRVAEKNIENLNAAQLKNPYAAASWRASTSICFR